jgi:hypothetical protein
MAKRISEADRLESANNTSIKTRREPETGLVGLQEIINNDIEEMEALIKKARNNKVSSQTHNKLIGFLVGFLYTDMPQVC